MTKAERRILAALAATGLCAMMSGCAADVAAPAREGTDVRHLRYYGGPKSPMWPAESEGQPRSD